MERVVNCCSEKDAANVAEPNGTALSCSEKVVNKDVNGSKDTFPGRVQEKIKGSWDRQGRNQGSCWLVGGAVSPDQEDKVVLLPPRSQGDRAWDCAT